MWWGGKTVTCNGTVTIGGEPGIIFENTLYYYGGDVTNSCVRSEDVPTWFKAGEGYIIATYDKDTYTTTMRLHNAAVTASDGAPIAENKLNIQFSGINTITTTAEAVVGDSEIHGIIAANGDTRFDLLLCGESGAVLNIITADAEVSECCSIYAGTVIVDGGTVNITAGDATDASKGIWADTVINGGTVNIVTGNAELSLGIDGTTTVAAGATLNLTLGKAELFAAGASITENAGTVNGLIMVPADNAVGGNYAASGNTVLIADFTATVMNMPVPFSVPEGTTLTVNEGVTLDLSGLTLDDIDFSGTIINNGTILLPAGFDMANAPKGGTVTIGEKSYTWDSENNKWICPEDGHSFGSDGKCTICGAVGYDIYVKGIRVNSTNCADVLGDDTVSYDAETQTLTLSGAVISTENMSMIIPALKVTGGDITLVLTGENKLTAADCPGISIDSGASVTVSQNSDGSLVVQGQSLGYLAQEKIHVNSSISGEGNFTVSGGTVTGGIHMGGTITITSGTVNADFLAAEDVVISGGTVTAAGYANVEYWDGNAPTGTYGIYAENDIRISGGTVTANGGYATISESYDATRVPVASATAAMFAGNTVTVTAGTVTAIGGQWNGYRPGDLGDMIMGNYAEEEEDSGSTENVIDRYGKALKATSFSISDSATFICGDGTAENHSHDYADATCTSGKVCAFCGTVIGEALGHSPVAGSYEDIGNGKHSFTCSVCGTATEAHTMDSTTGQCICGLEMAAASVTVGETVTYYATLDSAIRNADGGTLTVLKDVHTEIVTVSGTFTLDLNGCTITTFSATAQPFQILGTVTITDSSEAKTGGMTREGGPALRVDNKVIITGGRFQGDFGDIGVWDEDSTLILTLEDGADTGAVFPGGISINKVTLAEILGEGMAYWQNGKQITLTEGQQEITGGDVVVKQACTHEGSAHTEGTNAGEGKHSFTCTVCGGTGTESHSGGNATCMGKSCTTCGTYYGEVDASNHTYTSNVCCGSCGENAKWVLTGGTLTISGTGAMDDFSAILDGNTMTGTTAPWDGSRAKIQSVVVEEGITNIGSYAFGYQYTNLTSVSIANTVTSIGYAAFNSSGLTQVTIPGSVKTIGHSAFNECGDLVEIQLNEGLEKIDHFAFYGVGIETLTIPDSVTVIGRSLGAANPALKTIYMTGDSPSADTNMLERLQSDITVYISGKTASGYEQVGWQNEKVTLIYVDKITAVEAIADQTYTGSAIEPDLTVTNYKGETLTEGTDYTVVYSNNTNAGTAAVTVTGAGSYGGTIQLEYTIVPKPITVTIGDMSGTYGAEILELRATDDGIAEGDTDVYKLSTTATKDSDAGEYPITGEKLDSNYDITFVDGKYIINKALSKVTAQPGTPNLTYTGEAQKLVTAGTAVGGTMVYSATENGTYGNIPEASDADAYTIWYYVQGDKNHLDSAKDFVTVTISPASVTVTGKDAAVTYDGKNIDLRELFDIDENAGEADYTIIDLTGDGSSTTAPYLYSVTKAGTFTVQVKTAENGNYAAGEATAVLTVNKAVGSGAVSIEGWTYGDNPNAPAVGGSGEVTLLYTGENYSSNVAPTDAGTYTVTATFAATALYEEAIVTTQFTIAKAKADIDVDTTTINVTYGEAVTLPEAIANFGTVTCDKTAGDLVNAGTYTVTYTVEGTDNYDGDTKTLTVKVSQKAVEEPSATGTYTYTGSEQTVTLTGVESYMTVASGNKGTNAGNYEVVITLDANHKWADGSDGKVQWTIAKAYQTIQVIQPEAMVCGESHDLSVSAKTKLTYLSSDPTVVRADENGTLTALKDGAVSITITAQEDDNYLQAQETISVTVSHGYEQEITKPTCEDKGYTTYTCACGDSYVADYVDAKGHDYDDGVITTAPGCETEGVKTFTCRNDKSHTYTEKVTATGHAHQAVVTAPTCETRGYTTYTCACGDSYVADYVNPKGHAHQAVVTAPTCKGKGFTTYTCACGDRYVTDHTAPLGHAYTDKWDECCNVCGEMRRIKTVPMYRLYNPNTGEHFYTGSAEERDNLTAVGWNYEGVAWNAPVYIGDPVYRLYNPNNGDHHYTMSTAERDNLVKAGWNYEGVAWNSASATASGAVAMYRLYNPNAVTGTHHFTGSQEERDWLVSLGWKYEGIGWYGLLK